MLGTGGGKHRDAINVVIERLEAATAALERVLATFPKSGSTMSSTALGLDVHERRGPVSTAFPLRLPVAPALIFSLGLAWSEALQQRRGLRV
jgi:hypothetical protein